MEADGNAPHDPQGEFTGKNLLYISESIEEIAIRTGKDQQEVVEAIDRVRAKLFAARARRSRPHLDDKVLTAWNGLMIAALALAARTLGRQRYLDAARRAAAFIKSTLWNEREGRLLRRYREGDAGIDAYAEDYAFLISGLLELFQADGDPAWLEWAQTLQRRQDELFWDDEDGGWFSTTGRDPSVLLRMKEDYDGAEPAPSSVSVLNLITLEHLVGGGAWIERAERTLARFGPRLGVVARIVPMMLAGLSSWHADHTQIVVTGSGGDADALRRAVAERYLPFAVVVPVEPGARQQALAALLPFVGAMQARNGRATAYVCRGFTCREPVTEPAALLAQL
jgi:uncharacterized protein YyaL (SSP411 family)